MGRGRAILRKSQKHRTGKTTYDDAFCILTAAKKYFTYTLKLLSNNYLQLVKCYYCLEDYDNLENLVDSLQPDDKLLVTIGNMFATVGMGQQAVEAYTKVRIQ